jgi:hypothetical protein
MPRSRTRARLRAVRLAAHPSIDDPEKTAGTMGHLQRKIWHRFARLEDYDMWCDGQAVHPDRRTRRLAILAQIDKWFAALIAEETKASGEV